MGGVKAEKVDRVLSFYKSSDVSRAHVAHQKVETDQSGPEGEPSYGAMTDWHSILTISDGETPRLLH